MELKTKDETVLRRYLLGDVSTQEQEELELWLMSDENAYDLLEAAEDDLIDDSVAGRLKDRELDLFNTHFLAAPERQRKLQFGRSLQRVIDATTPDIARTILPSPLPSPRTFSFWQGLLDGLRYRPALGYAVSALIVVMVVGTVWSVFKTAELQRELNSTTGQLANLGREREELRRQLGESQSLTQRLQAQFRALEESVTAVKSLSTPPVLLALNLAPGITRSSNDVPKITITPNNKLAQFSLTLLDDNYNTYRAALLDADGREIWTRDTLSATATRDGKAVVLVAPTEVLSDGAYSISLMGTQDSRPPESVGRYYFRAFRQ